MEARRDLECARSDQWAGQLVKGILIDGLIVLSTFGSYIDMPRLLRKTNGNSSGLSKLLKSVVLDLLFPVLPPSICALAWVGGMEVRFVRHFVQVKTKHT
jgi:hypothetical protein